MIGMKINIFMVIERNKKKKKKKSEINSIREKLEISSEDYRKSVFNLVTRSWKNLSTITNLAPQLAYKNTF